MQTPNKETRLKHYSEVLESYETAPTDYHSRLKGICDRIWGYWYYGECGVGHVYKLYPELTTFKPENAAYLDYWFDTTEERIECLKKCIEMCESE